MEYRELLQKMLDQYSEMIGEVAYTQAGNIDGLEVQDNQVKGSPGPEVLQAMIDSYSQIMGEGSVAVARNAVKEAYEDDKSVKSLDIPEEIKPRELKADEFASAL